MALPNLGAPALPANAASPEIIVNTNDNLLDYAMNSHIAINFSSDADLTLSTTGTPQQWQNGTIEFTDTGVVLTAGRNVIVPDNERIYRIINNAAQTLTVKTSAGTGIAVSASAVKHVQCDGTNVIDASPVGSDTTYTVSAETDASGAVVRLTGSDASTDEILLNEGSNITITRDDADTITIASTGVGDADAIHDNVAGEIAALTTVTAASGDYILIEDVSDSNNKKKILASDLLGAGTDAAAIHDDTANEITAITAKTTIDPDDKFLIEDSEASYVKKAVTYAAMMQVEENAQTGISYTLVADDVFKIVTMTNASASTLTVPPNSSIAFPIGTQIIVTQQGAGQVTLTEGSGVTINAPDSTLTLRTQYSSVSLIKMDTDEWIAAGDLG